jgi:hypothetical protein
MVLFTLVNNFIKVFEKKHLKEVMIVAMTKN